MTIIWRQKKAMAIYFIAIIWRVNKSKKLFWMLSLKETLFPSNSN